MGPEERNTEFQDVEQDTGKGSNESSKRWSESKSPPAQLHIGKETLYLSLRDADRVWVAGVAYPEVVDENQTLLLQNSHHLSGDLLSNHRVENGGEERVSEDQVHTPVRKGELGGIGDSEVDLRGKFFCQFDSVLEQVDTVEVCAACSPFGEGSEPAPCPASYIEGAQPAEVREAV